jgi:hypothetical protein
MHYTHRAGTALFLLYFFSPVKLCRYCSSVSVCMGGKKWAQKSLTTESYWNSTVYSRKKAFGYGKPDTEEDIPNNSLCYASNKLIKGQCSYTEQCNNQRLF